MDDDLDEPPHEKWVERGLAMIGYLFLFAILVAIAVYVVPAANEWFRAIRS